MEGFGPGSLLPRGDAASTPTAGIIASVGSRRGCGHPEWLFSPGSADPEPISSLPTSLSEPGPYC